MGDSNNNSNPEKVLEEFRNAWKQEVKKKHVRDKPESGTTLAQTKQEDTLIEEEGLAKVIDKTKTLDINTPVTAMDHYMIAVDNERQGKLGQGNKYSDDEIVSSY